ncbi:putative oxidoreductase GLYR1 [Bienertia sinuspersici]
MVSVMNNDFDLERNAVSASETEESRVSNDNVRDEGVSSLHLNDEIRVSSGPDLDVQKCEVDETRVLDGGGRKIDRARVFDVETDYHANGDTGNLGEMGVRNAQEEVLDTATGFASTSNGVGPVGDGRMKPKAFCKVDSSLTGSGDGDFRLETRGSMQASMSKDGNANKVEDDSNAGSLKVMGSRFEMGDMVWGKVKSHPWWPGHLFNEAFATSSVRRTRRHGYILVAFFGDSSYGWFDPTELVPYDPHYAEKSQQTASRSFMRAVEESIDEASRRSALGLSCCCRNPTNFRPVNVPGYAAVDVVDYEPGAIYSLNQIRKARESFHPFDTLSYIKQLAIAPMSGDTKNLDFVKKKATTLAYRRAIFEEFDETYAQAFSQQPLRPSQSPADKEPSRAPLSGPLVMAETLGGRKSSTKATKTKEQSKKDRYLFKRRDEAAGLRASKTTQGHPSSSSSSAYEDGTSDTAAAAYVFQKRDSAVSNDELGAGVSVLSGSQALKSSSVVTADLGNVSDKIPDKQISSLTSPDAVHLEENEETEKVDGQRSIDHVEGDSFVSGGAVKSAGMPVEIAASSSEDIQVNQCRVDNEATNSVGLVSSVAGGHDTELSQMLADLRGLALNPVHGIGRNGPAITRQFFLKYRSSIFLKSSSASTSESELSEPRAMRSTSASEVGEKPASESSKSVFSSKQQKLSARHENSVKGRKRVPSERQEENAAKRAKKITDVKSLSADKRALHKTQEMQQRPEGKAKVVAAQSPQAKLMKSEQREKKADRPPKVEEPTYLIMKYQSGSSLPSLVELKARFARFGPLDTSLSRVFYKTNTCRVAFLYKQDAHVACRYAMGSKSIFSNVRCLVKPVAAPESQPPSSGKVEDVQSESAANRDSSAGESIPVVPTATPQQPVQQLKSCLKKPSGGDETGGPSNGGGNGRTPRVRFNMGEVKGVVTDDNRGGLQGQTMESRNSMLSSNEGSSSSSVTMDVSNNQRLTVSSHPLQPPLLPLPPQFIRPPMNPQYHHHMVELSPKINLHDNQRVVPPLPLPENQAPPQPTRDISQQMMNLLTRCHDVVTNVKSVLGYVPYHPL